MVRKRKMWELHVDVSLNCDDASSLEWSKVLFYGHRNQVKCHRLFKYDFYRPRGREYFLLENVFRR